MRRSWYPLLLIMLLVSAIAQNVPAPVIRTQEELDRLPVGRSYWWYGKLLTKEAVPVATPRRVATQEDYDAVAVGNLYWARGYLLLRHSNSRSVLDDEIYDYSFWRHLYPVGDRSSDDNPVPGSNAVWPIQVDSQEDYDRIPAGAWVRDDYGKIVQKQPTPKPIVEPTPTPELGSSAEYPIVLFSKAQADSVPNGKWVVDSLGKPWQQRRHVATFDASSLTSVAGVVAMFLVAGGVVFGLWKSIYSQGRPATQPNPGASQKKSALVFSDYEQFKLATQLWSRDRSIFENNEAARLTQLGEWAKRGRTLTTIGFWVFAAATFFVGRAHGAGAGWGTAIFGLMVVGMLVSAEERFRRWRNKALFVRREFSEPEPVYQPPRQTDPPPPRTDPPPRSEPPPRAEPSRPVDPVRITTMRQAYEILGLPPGRISMEAARAVHRKRMMEYHPDRVAHLGPELRVLAERKATEFNLAVEFIEKNRKSYPS